MTFPTVGTTWRSHATGSVYRIAEIDLARPCECVRLELVTPSEQLLSVWIGIAETNRRARQEPDTAEGVRALNETMWTELAWFERAATFVREAEPTQVSGALATQGATP